MFFNDLIRRFHDAEEKERNAESRLGLAREIEEGQAYRNNVEAAQKAIEQSNEAQHDLKQLAEQCRQLEEFRQQLQQQIQTAELTRQEHKFLLKYEKEFEMFRQEEERREYRGYSR